jgi:CheY-specific phosphatase CheX
LIKEKENTYMVGITDFNVKDAIVDSVGEVFDMMLSMTVSYVTGTDIGDDPGKSILGSISLIGDVSGMVDIRVSDSFSRKMVGSMLDMEPDEVEIEDIQDVLGEVCNMVAGSLKSGLCDAGMTCELSTPALISGKDYDHEARNMQRYELFGFECDGNAFSVNVGLKPAIIEGLPESPRESTGDGSDFDIHKYNMENSVVNSVAEVFEMMLSMDAAPYTNDNGTGMESNRIVGAISLSGKVMGRVNLHIPVAFSYRITTSLLGIEPDEIEDMDEVKDVVGELCNMISGALKSDLCDAGMDCRVSPPSFTTGSDFEMECLHLVRHERYLFINENDVFMVEIGLRPGDR